MTNLLGQNKSKSFTLSLDWFEWLKKLITLLSLYAVEDLEVITKIEIFKLFFVSDYARARKTWKCRGGMLIFNIFSV